LSQKVDQGLGKKKSVNVRGLAHSIRNKVGQNSPSINIGQTGEIIFPAEKGELYKAMLVLNKIQGSQTRGPRT